MNKLFICKTNEGHIIKTMGELLQNNIKTGCYIIDTNGIKQRIMDNNKAMLIDINLQAENFNTFKLEQGKIYTFGINHQHFYKMLKSIKKKDIVSLFIDNESTLDLGIEIMPKEKNRVTTSYIKMQQMQNLAIDIEDGYEKPIIISSTEFQKMIKDMNNICNTISITSKNHTISFCCDADGVYKRNVMFGEEEYDGNIPFTQQFDTELLTRISKISGLNNVIYIYQSKDLPLKISSQIGNLGKINIYIKSKDQIEDENMNNDEEDDE
jgi:proliferating cell nuclear antigen PCNA